MNRLLITYTVVCFLLFIESISANEESVLTTPLKDASMKEVETQNASIFAEPAPLMIQKKILTLLDMSKVNPDAAKALSMIYQSSSEEFNIAEQYLLVIADAVIFSNQGENGLLLQTVNRLKDSMSTEDKIPYQQLILPHFSQIHLLLSKLYTQNQQHKLAYEQKALYLDKYQDHRDWLRELRIKKLNLKYETDLKTDTHKLLAFQKEFQKLQLKEAEQKEKEQFNNIFILLAIAIGFLFLLIRQLKVRSKLQILSKTDSLTGLFNRRTLFEQGQNLFDISLKLGQDICIILIDIDHFKQVNDTFGHDVGDEIIKCIAKTGNEVIRTRDIFARLGGEEFVIILPETPHDQAKAIAEHFREKIEQLNLKEHGENLSLTISVGVVSLADSFDNFDSLLNAADLAMYHAKSHGRNQVCSYNKQVR